MTKQIKNLAHEMKEIADFYNRSEKIKKEITDSIRSAAEIGIYHLHLYCSSGPYEPVSNFFYASLSDVDWIKKWIVDQGFRAIFDEDVNSIFVTWH